MPLKNVWLMHKYYAKYCNSRRIERVYPICDVVYLHSSTYDVQTFGKCISRLRPFHVPYQKEEK